MSHRFNFTVASFVSIVAAVGCGLGVSGGCIWQTGPDWEYDNEPWRGQAPASTSIDSAIPASSAGGATASAQPSAPVTAPDLIPRARLFGNPDRTALRVSPDSKRLAFLAPHNGVMNVWVCPIDDMAAAKAVTSDAARGIRQYQWTYTGSHIAYLQDRGGDENWKVFVADLDSGKETDLTPFEEIAGPDGKPIMLPGGKKMRPAARIMSLSERQPDVMLIGLNNRDPQYHDVWRINIRTAERALVLVNEQFSGFIVDEDMNIRLAVKPTSDGGQEVMKMTAPPGADGKGAKFETIATIGSDDALTTSPEGFDGEGKTLYWVDSRGRNTAAIIAMNVETGATTLLAEDKRADAGAVMTHPARHTIEAVSFNYTRNEWKVLDDAIRPDMDYLRTVADGDITVASRSLDDQWWTVSYVVDNGPARMYLYDRKARKATLAFTVRKSLEGLTLAKMHPVVVKTGDGFDLVCYLSLPVESDPRGTGRPMRPLPLILDVHGGPWARDVWGFNSEHQWLANRGYAVLSVNYRGSTGFGKAFINAGNQQWAAKMHEDLIDAVNWAIRERIADAKKVAIYGGSYGGYSALVGVTFTPKVFACSVDIVGPSNLVTLLNTIPPYWKPLLETFAKRVGDPRTEEGKKLLESRSPLNFIDRIERPLLIGQGANDPRVKQSEADQIVQAMQAKNIPVTYVLFPDEGHGFARPQNRLAFFAIAEAFLSQHLGGRIQPIGEDFSGSSVTVPTGGAFVPGLEGAGPTGPATGGK